MTHRNLLEDSFAIGKMFSFHADMSFLTVCPLFHNSGQIPTTLLSLWCGATSTAVRSDMGMLKFWHYADRFKASWSYVMPAFLSYLALRDEAPAQKTLQGIFCGGQVLAPELLRRFESRFSIPIYQAYGLTETTSFATCGSRDDSMSRASVASGRTISSHMFSKSLLPIRD